MEWDQSDIDINWFDLCLKYGNGANVYRDMLLIIDIGREREREKKGYH